MWVSNTAHYPEKDLHSEKHAGGSIVSKVIIICKTIYNDGKKKSERAPCWSLLWEQIIPISPFQFQVATLRQVQEERWRFLHCILHYCKHASVYASCIRTYPASSTTGAWSNDFSFRILMVFLMLTDGRTVRGAESRSSCRVRFHHLHRRGEKRPRSLHSWLEI